MDSIVLKSFFPEIFFSLGIFLQLIFNARLINTLKYNFPVIDREVFIQTVFILFCVLILLFNLKIEAHLSNFLFVNDSGGCTAKLLFIVTCLLTLPVIFRSFVLQKLNFFEYYIILSLALFASLLLFSVFDLISGYLVIEMQALAFYVLASYKRNSSFSTEAGLKYFISGSFISGIFLLGCSLIYGSLGTLNFNDLSLLLSFKLDDSLENLNFILILGILLVVFTLLFKISAAPFHFWSPDVYDGSPLATTIVFSIFPKLVIFTFFVRWISAISNIYFEIKFIFIFIGLLSLIFGTFFAIKQKRLKRLIVFSSIVQVGFMISALAQYSVDGMVALYYFLFIYILSSILIWNNVALLYTFCNVTNKFYKENIRSVFLSSLSNMSKTNKTWAFSFVIVFFSLAGIPPFGGFLAKALVLFSLIGSNEVVAAGLMMLISLVSVFYYVRIIKLVYFEPKKVTLFDERFQTPFETTYLNLDCTIIAFIMSLLILAFFNPTIFLLLGQYIVLGLFGF